MLECELDRSDLQALRLDGRRDAVVEDVGEHADEHEREAGGGALEAREGAVRRLGHDAEPEVAVGDLALGVLGGERAHLALLGEAGRGQHAVDLAVVALHRQPPLAEEVELLARLQVVDEEVLEEPAGVSTLA